MASASGVDCGATQTSTRVHTLDDDEMVKHLGTQMRYGEKIRDPDEVPKEEIRAVWGLG